MFSLFLEEVATLGMEMGSGDQKVEIPFVPWNYSSPFQRNALYSFSSSVDQFLQLKCFLLYARLFSVFPSSLQNQLDVHSLSSFTHIGVNHFSLFLDHKNRSTYHKLVLLMEVGNLLLYSVLKHSSKQIAPCLTLGNLFNTTQPFCKVNLLLFAPS